MGLKQQMTGSPWHAEKMTRQEGDARRHKSHCLHYQWQCNGCDLGGQCHGSAHCPKYKRMTEAQEAAVLKQKKDQRRASSSKDEDDGVYWY